MMTAIRHALDESFGRQQVASVDLLAIAFGIRNVTQLSAALAEIHRVLAPGGRFAYLHFGTKPIDRSH